MYSHIESYSVCLSVSLHLHNTCYKVLHMQYPCVDPIVPEREMLVSAGTFDYKMKSD